MISSCATKPSGQSSDSQAHRNSIPGTEEKSSSEKGLESNEADEIFKFLKVRETNGDGSYTEFIYDSDLHLLAEERYGQNGGFFYTYAEYSYDAYGNLIKSDIFNEGITTYEYDSSGNQTKKEEYYDDGALSCVTEYVMGVPTRETHYLDGGDVSDWIEYSYDSNGNPIEKIYYNKEGRATRKNTIEYTYDTEGQMTSETSFTSDGDIAYKIEYIYDNIKEPLEVIKYNNEGEITMRADREVDKNGNVTALTTYDGDGDVFQREERTYDAEGRVLTVQYISSRILDENDPDYRFEYAYDEYGNIIMKNDQTYKYVLAKDYQAYLAETAVSGLTKLDWIQIRDTIDFYCRDSSGFGGFINDCYGDCYDYGTFIDTEMGPACLLLGNLSLSEIKKSYQEYAKPYYSQKVIKQRLSEMDTYFPVQNGQLYAVAAFGDYIGCDSDGASLYTIKNGRYLISVPLDIDEEIMTTSYNFEWFYFVRENGKMVCDGDVWLS